MHWQRYTKTGDCSLVRDLLRNLYLGNLLKVTIYCDGNLKLRNKKDNSVSLKIILIQIWLDNIIISLTAVTD
jgi:hypothetical protein